MIFRIQSSYRRTCIKTPVCDISLHSVAMPSSTMLFSRFLCIRGPPKSPLQALLLSFLPQNWFAYLFGHLSSSTLMARFMDLPLLIEVVPQPEAISGVLSSGVDRPKGRQIGFIVSSNSILLSSSSRAMLLVTRPSLLIPNDGWAITFLMPYLWKYGHG